MTNERILHENRNYATIERITVYRDVKVLILFTLHSRVRWAVLLVGLVAFMMFGLGYMRNSPFQAVDGGLMSGFRGLLDLQILIGILFLLWNGFAGAGFPAFRILYGGTMIIGLWVAHLSSRWKYTEDQMSRRRWT